MLQFISKKNLKKLVGECNLFRFHASIKREKK